jgi:hypothetical protein
MTRILVMRAVNLLHVNSLFQLTKLASTPKKDLINLDVARLAAQLRRIVSIMVVDTMVVVSVRCMMLSALAVVATLRYRLSQVAANQYTAMIVIAK